MGSMSIVHWAILLAIVLLLFGAGRLPSVMGDFAKGIKAFKAGMKDEDDKPGNAGPGSIAQNQTVPAHGPAGEAQTVGGERRVG